MAPESGNEVCKNKYHSIQNFFIIAVPEVGFYISEFSHSYYG
jgi:hypothetical protein